MAKASSVRPLLFLVTGIGSVEHRICRKIVLGNWLVNPTGKENSFVELDLMQEHLNYWIKVRRDCHAHSLALSLIVLIELLPSTWQRCVMGMACNDLALHRSPLATCFRGKWHSGLKAGKSTCCARPYQGHQNTHGQPREEQCV